MVSLAPWPIGGQTQAPWCRVVLRFSQALFSFTNFKWFIKSPNFEEHDSLQFDALTSSRNHRLIIHLCNGSSLSWMGLTRERTVFWRNTDFFFLRTSFSSKIQNTLIHLSHAFPRVIPFGYAQTKGVDHGNSSIPWSWPSTNSRPRYSKNDVFLLRKNDSWQQYWPFGRCF